MEHLTAIADAADAITEMFVGHCRESFAGDEVLRGAVLVELATIAEAAARLRRPFRDAHPEVGWASMDALASIAKLTDVTRNWMAVWPAVAVDLPDLGRGITSLVADASRNTKPR